MPELTPLYPIADVLKSGHLDTNSVHQVYWESCGNPDGKPVIFVHGGPGGGTSPDTRRFFNPDKYHIIQMDQRGCGKSTPHACLDNNTTWDLIADMESIRKMLGIEKWQVFGGSWGSTLALAYAEKHPNVVTELVLRGIFLMREHELQWFYQHGCSRFYPDAWQPFWDHIPEDEQHDMITAYQKRLLSDDETTRLEAATRWSIWEGSTCHLVPNLERIDQTADPEFALAFARIENHYFTNKGFFTHENQLLDEVDKIRHIPTVIIQGRYDVICTVEPAYELKQAFPEAELIIAPDAGHSAFEASIASELVKATDRFVD